MHASRLPTALTAPQTSADDFGLVAWLEQTRVRLPLRGVEVRFHVAGPLARVELVQIFQNTRTVPLDIGYQFPLPAAASVYRCELVAAGRTIAAVVEADAEARRQFDEAKAAGHRAALVQARRDNLFQLQLGNLQPGEIVAIRLGYVQELERAVRTVALRIPVCPGERYVPGAPLLRSNQGRGALDDTDQVPDASLISPPRIDALHPDAALFHLCGELPAGAVAAGSVASPSHLVALRETEGNVRVGFAGDGNVPDRDFILRWELPELVPGAAELLTGRHGGRRYGMLRFAPPAQPVRLRPAPRQIWFLVDRSGSMQGLKWTRTCRALLDCVAGLRPEDRVFVTFFESAHRHFAEQPLAPAVLLADPCFRAIESLGVDGGTEMLPALSAVLKLRESHRDPAAAAHLVVITDGAVANEAAVLRELAPHTDLAVHVIGIDTTVNDGLLSTMAERHGGRCMLLSPNESVAEAVELVLRGSTAPVLRNLRLAAGVTSPTPLPANTAALETSLVVEGDWTDGAPLLEAETADGGRWTCIAASSAGDAEALRLIAARRAIDRLQRAGDQEGAVALAKQTNLLCEGASFLAIDRATKVAVATEAFEQPVFAACEEGPHQGICCSERGFAEPAGSVRPSRTERFVVGLLRRRRDNWRPPTWPGATVETFDRWYLGTTPVVQSLGEELTRALRGDGVDPQVPLPALVVRALGDWWSAHAALLELVRNVRVAQAEGGTVFDLAVLRRFIEGDDVAPPTGLGACLPASGETKRKELQCFRTLQMVILDAPLGTQLLTAFRRDSIRRAFEAALAAPGILPARGSVALP